MLPPSLATAIAQNISDPMIDDDLNLFSGDAHKACRAYSDPLFLQDHFLSDGHHERIHNGTATFVSRRGRVYACTCRHVADAVHNPTVTTGLHPTAALMYGKVIQNLSFWSTEGLRLALRSPQTGDDEHHADVSIVELGHTWDFLRARKPKTAIDLDKWEPPPWDEVKFCHAAGYPDEHKSSNGMTVSSPMALVTAEVASNLSKRTREFSLSSKLDHPHGYYFSGISGGPILGVWGERFTPIGLVFEGEPSSATASSALTDPNDILIRGLLLTPERFDTWLAMRA